jgi:DNA-binding LytR/AlgR family response regulator
MDIFIIDDDVAFSEMLKKDIINHFSVLYDDFSICIIYENFNKILDFQSIDLVFMDIDLRTGYNGINLASYIKCIFPQVLLIFVSFNDEFVFPALSVDFFQFIRKTKYQYDVSKVLNQTRSYLAENTMKIAVKIHGRKYSIKLSDINYILSIGRDLIIKTNDSDFTMFCSLKSFMEKINYQALIQIERNLVINLNFTESVTKTKVIMLNGEVYNVGRKYQNPLIEKYEIFLLK